MSSISQVSWVQSIRFKIIFLILVTTCSVLAVSGYFAYEYTRQNATAELEELAKVTATRLSRHLETPMWDVDYEQVGSLLETEMQEQKISGLLVIDEDGRTVFSGRVRESDGGVTEINLAPTGDFVNDSRNVRRGDKDIGRVQVYLTRQSLTEELNQFARNIALIGAVLALVLIVIIGFALGRIVVKPVRELASAADAMSRGDLKQEFIQRRNDEIGVLAKTLDRMQNSMRVAIIRLRKATS